MTGTLRYCVLREGGVEEEGERESEGSLPCIILYCVVTLFLDLQHGLQYSCTTSDRNLVGNLETVLL